MRGTWLWVLRLLTLAAGTTACASHSATARHMTQVEQTALEEHSPEKLLRRGRAFLRIGDHTRAIQYFTDAIRAGAREPEVARPLMLAYVESNQYRLAIDFGQDYLRRHPDDYRLHFLVGTLLNAVGRHDAAVQHLREVVRLNARFAEAHYVLAVVYRDHEREPVLADSHFRQYLGLQPDGAHASEAKAGLLRSVQ